MNNGSTTTDTTMRLTIEELHASGKGLGRTEERKVVLVAGALPGETVEVLVEGEKRSIIEGSVGAIFAPSPHRIAPACPYYGHCGGCDLQHLAYEAQVTEKQGLLQRLLAHRGLVDVNILPPVTGSPWEYRCRFQFHWVAHRGRLPTYGLKAAKSDEVVEIEDCLVAMPAIRTALRDKRLGQYMLAKQHKTVMTGDRCMVAGVVGDHMDWVGSNQRYFVKVLNKSFCLHVNCFFQSNLHMLEKLIPTVLEGLGGDAALDLYGGAGLFARFLTDRFRHVTLVEQNETSVIWAEVNLRDLSHTSAAQSAALWCAQNPNARFDAVVADPPRMGLEPPVIAWLAAARPRHLRYVSCSPTSLAQDAAFLVAAGFRLVSVQLFDFYPQTHHIESLACFEDASQGGLRGPLPPLRQASLDYYLLFPHPPNNGWGEWGY
jgi:23S rRNA (uracil1939-C5)-methyltransferase